MRPSPITFPDQVIRLLLQGAKSQLRKPVREQVGPGCSPDVDLEGVWTVTGTGQDFNLEMAQALDCPFGKSGDRLWVQEPFRTVPVPDGSGHRLIYRATARVKTGTWQLPAEMEEAQARLQLKVLGVRVEKLRDIAEEDAKASGAFQWMKDITDRHPKLDKKMRARWFERSREIDEEHAPNFRGLFSMMWDSSTTKKTESWSYNPWVWVVHLDPEAYHPNGAG